MNTIARRYFWIFFWLMAVTTGGARADMLPHYSLRHLAINAQAVVEAVPQAPLDGHSPVTFTVIQVLKGTIQAGASLRVGRLDFYRAASKSQLFPDAQSAPGPVTSALLFLRREWRDPPGQWNLMASGIRLLTRDGRILRPQQMMNPGDYLFFSVADARWDAMLDNARADLKEAAAVRALREIPDVNQRNQALLRWIEAHQNEFSNFHNIIAARWTEPILLRGYQNSEYLDGTGPEWEAHAAQAGKDWGELETQTFDWVMESRVPADALRALRLWVTIHGQNYYRQAENGHWIRAFATPVGRELLVGVALNQRESDALRREALFQIAFSLREVDNHYQLPRDEQEHLIGALLPLLKQPDARLRRVAIGTLIDLSERAAQSSGAAVAQLEIAVARETDEANRRNWQAALARLKQSLKPREED